MYPFGFRKNIIATDLALYFANQKFLSNLISTGEFNSGVTDHRDAMLSLMMTGADLCAVTKPWHTQGRTVRYLYNEFFHQVGCQCWLWIFVLIWYGLVLFLFSYKRVGVFLFPV